MFFPRILMSRALNLNFYQAILRTYRALLRKCRALLTFPNTVYSQVEGTSWPISIYIWRERALLRENRALLTQSNLLAEGYIMANLVGPIS